jgi:hypothetical protein
MVLLWCAIVENACTFWSTGGEVILDTFDHPGQKDRRQRFNSSIGLCPDLNIQVAVGNEHH